MDNTLGTNELRAIQDYWQRQMAAGVPAEAMSPEQLKQLAGELIARKKQLAEWRLTPPEPIKLRLGGGHPTGHVA